MIRFSLIILLAISLSSCGYIIAKPLANNYIKKNEASLVPENFFASDHTLIIILNEYTQTSYNRKIKKVDKLYNGQHKYMTLSEYDSLNKEDEELRYSFSYIYGPSQTANGTVQVRTFYLYDRIDEKTYKCDIHSSSYMRIVESYFNHLEERRVKK